jgi:hypothetical protein
MVAHRILVLHPLPTNIAAGGRKSRMYPCQVFVQVGAPRYEFSAQPTLQGLRGTSAHFHGGCGLVMFFHEGYKQGDR